jgi:hypothetical protein
MRPGINSESETAMTMEGAMRMFEEVEVALENCIADSAPKMAAKYDIPVKAVQHAIPRQFVRAGITYSRAGLLPLHQWHQPTGNEQLTAERQFRKQKVRKPC